MEDMMKKCLTFSLLIGMPLLLYTALADSDSLHRGMGVGLFNVGKIGNKFTLSCTIKDPAYSVYEAYFHTRIYIKGYLEASPGAYLRSSCSLATSPVTNADLQVIPTREPNRLLLRGYFSKLQYRGAQLPPIFQIICHTDGYPNYADVNAAVGLNDFTEPGVVGLNISCNLQPNHPKIWYEYR